MTIHRQKEDLLSEDLEFYGFVKLKNNPINGVRRKKLNNWKYEDDYLGSYSNKKKALKT